MLAAHAIGPSLLYEQRDAAGASSALILLGVLFMGLARPVMEPVAKLSVQSIALTMAEAPPPPPEPPPPQSKPVVQAAQAVTPKIIAPTVVPKPFTPAPRVLADAPAPSAVAPAPLAPTPDASPRSVAPQAASEPVQPAPAVQAAASPLTAPAPVPAPSPAAKSDRYEAQVLRYLESIKRYPSSREARQTRPAGTVTVWFELSRSGKVLDAGIEKPSSSSLLDFEALKTVRGGNFPAFPEGAFAGAEKKRFSAHLNYELKNAD